MKPSKPGLNPIEINASGHQPSDITHHCAIGCRMDFSVLKTVSKKPFGFTSHFSHLNIFSVMLGQEELAPVAHLSRKEQLKLYRTRKEEVMGTPNKENRRMSFGLTDYTPDKRLAKVATTTPQAANATPKTKTATPRPAARKNALLTSSRPLVVKKTENLSRYLSAQMKEASQCAKVNSQL